MPRMRLDWPVDTMGYRLEQRGGEWRVDFDGRGQKPHLALREDGTAKRFASRREAEKFMRQANRSVTIASGGLATWLVGNGGEPKYYNCLAIDGLWREFAAIKTEEAARSLADKRGLPDGKHACPAESLLAAGHVMRTLIAASDRRDAEALANWFQANERLMRLQPELKGREVILRPTSLTAAAFYQFFEDATGGQAQAALRQCKRPGCGNWFKYGPGTKHRETAEYCSPKCQKADAYQRSKERKHGHRH